MLNIMLNALPRLFKECKSLLLSGIISQQDGAPAHTVKLAQDWIAAKYSELFGKDELPPTRRTLTLLIVMSEVLCLNAIRDFSLSQTTLMD